MKELEGAVPTLTGRDASEGNAGSIVNKDMDVFASDPRAAASTGGASPSSSRSFANLRSNKRLDRFTYRRQKKVQLQWLLYCLVHNFEKLAHKSKTYSRKKPRRALLRPWPHQGKDTHTTKHPRP